MDELVKRAKKIIEEILYITIATSDKSGQPWNSPVYAAYDENYNFFWVSWKENVHSRNIAENPRVFIVIYDSKVPEGTGEGVYIKAKAQVLTDEKEIENAIGAIYGRAGKNPKKRSSKEFLGDYPRRIYKAVPEKFWINADGEVNGQYTDKRVEIKF